MQINLQAYTVPEIEGGVMWIARDAENPTTFYGQGKTPKEAIGDFVLSFPHPFNIEAFSWITRPPNKDYPSGPV